jgi:hypothetical protein
MSVRRSTLGIVLAVAIVLASLLTTAPAARYASAEDSPGNEFFARTWQRTDEPVAGGAVSRTWVWGPAPFSGQVGETYVDAPGGVRLVQYFDKSRMEVNDPAYDPTSIWFVTNGLLAKELITGEMQVGDNAFEPRGPANVNIAGDPTDPDGPTYASFLPHLGAPPAEEDAAITSTIDRAGAIGCCVPNNYGVTTGPLVSETGHRVASVFWNYLNSEGPIIERGRRTSGRLFANPYYATGFPIGEAYWAQVQVAGIAQWVLVQPFERRVLTYTPGNAAGWEVEMGNVGRHYYTWRYGESGSPMPAPDWTLPPYPRWLPAGQEVDVPDLEAHYDLHIASANVDTGVVVAHEVITISAFNEARPEQLYLQVVPAQYGFFTLDSLMVNDVPTTPISHFGGVSLEVPISGASLPITIEIDFTLRVGREPTGWGGTSLDNGILRLGYWFPIISDRHGYSATLDASQSRVANFDVTVDLHATVAMAQAGRQIGTAQLGDGRQRYYLRGDRMRDFALVLARGFSTTERTTPSGVRIVLYSHPSSDGTLSDEAVGFRNSRILDAAVDAVSQLEHLVGPYVYGTLMIVDVGPTMPGGLEFPALIYINPAYVPLDRLIYHEVAHQWLHAMVGNRTLIDGWIDEGGAEFFERGLPTGFTEIPSPPPGGYQYWLDSTYLELPGDSSRQWYYSIYEQGARFYYDVAHTMGWERFWRAFQAIYAEHLYGIVTASDMLATFQEHSTTDLRPLFDEYFRYEWVWELLPPGY